MSPKLQHIVHYGQVTSVNRGNILVSLDALEHQVITKRCGKMNHNNIRVIVGDRVEVKIDPYTLARGIITKRL